jgi:hypothetical protein
MKRSIAALACVLAAACGSKSSGGGGGNPVAPSAPTVTGLTISGGDTMRTGQTQPYTATVTLSNGTTQAATSPTWSSDNSGILTIDNSGQASGSTHGTATITASAQGASATKTVKVFQNYQGTWNGSYRIRVCTATGVFAGIWCEADGFAANSIAPMRVTFTQDGAAVNGTLELGSISGNIKGSVFDSRRFVGGGVLTILSSGIVLSLNVGTFDVLSSGNQLSGTFVVNTTASGASGNGYFETDLTSVTRSLTASGVRPLPTLRFESMQELLKAHKRGE